jgi:subtilisin family serine protease
VRHAAAKADGHGTAVAGVIGARGDLIGIAPASELLAVQAFVKDAAGGKQLATSFILPHAIDWSIQNGARILNLSFSGPPDPIVEEIIDAAITAGAIVVAAAGNGGPEADAAYPAAYPGVIAVTATDKREGLYAKANHGTYVAIAAPGVGIFAPVPKGGYDFKTGTSFAAPHVSGLVALMLERRGTLTAKDVRAALLNTAIDLGPPGPDTLYGSGRTDAFASVEAVIAGKLTEIPRGVALPTRPTSN